MILSVLQIKLLNESNRENNAVLRFLWNPKKKVTYM